MLVDRPLITAIAAEVIAKISDEDSQDLSLTAWAYAALSEYHEPLLHAISSQAIKTLTEYKSNEISNTVWAFSTLL